MATIETLLIVKNLGPQQSKGVDILISGYGGQIVNVSSGENYRALQVHLPEEKIENLQRECSAKVYTKQVKTWWLGLRYGSHVAQFGKEWNAR